MASLFWLLFVSAFMLAFMQGGREARSFAAILLLAVVVTFLLNDHYGFVIARPLVLVVDVCVLATALVLVVRSESFWPLWFAGFHAISVSSGLAAMLFPRGIQTLYIDSAGFWTTPALIAFAGGVWLDSRGRDPAMSV